MKGREEACASYIYPILLCRLYVLSLLNAELMDLIPDFFYFLWGVKSHLVCRAACCLCPAEGRALRFANMRSSCISWKRTVMANSGRKTTANLFCPCKVCIWTRGRPVNCPELNALFIRSIKTPFYNYKDHFEDSQALYQISGRCC